MTIYVDNFRLVSGEEAAGDVRRGSQPQDTVSIIDNRWVSVRQVARAGRCTRIGRGDRGLRKQAERESELLQNTIQAAQTQGIDTIYAERHLVTADLGLRRAAAARLVQQRREEARDVPLRSRDVPGRAARIGGYTARRQLPPRSGRHASGRLR